MGAPIAGEGDLWAPPRWFNAALRDKWNEMLETAPKGLLTGTDKDLLVTWCVACVGHAAAAKDLISEEMTMEHDNGVVVANPKIGIMNKHAETMMRLSKLLGFNPASRMVLGAIGAGAIPGQLIEGSVASYIEEKPASLPAA